jgi:hypothetical protein
MIAGRVVAEETSKVIDGPAASKAFYLLKFLFSQENLRQQH